MVTVISSDSVEGMVQYLAWSEEHKTVKPYYLYLDYDADLAPTNCTPDNKYVQIHNGRALDMPERDMFSELGFTQVSLDCGLTPEEYWDPRNVQKVLYPRYKSIARMLFPTATRVEVLEHATRKRHPKWMSETIERHHLRTNQPSDYVHIDMTASSAAKCAIKEFNIYPRDHSRYVVFNIWKPIKGPVFDFPLTLCDRRTVEYESQTTAMDVVTHNFANENTRVYFDEKHDWYYWHGLEVNEAIVFMQADSAAPNQAGVPHTAFRDPRVGDNTQLRESIEARVFVYFD